MAISNVVVSRVRVRIMRKPAWLPSHVKRRIVHPLIVVIRMMNVVLVVLADVRSIVQKSIIRN
jgi:hypothetical protein